MVGLILLGVVLAPKILSGMAALLILGIWGGC